jgi:hypothetical protein
LRAVSLRFSRHKHSSFLRSDLVSNDFVSDLGAGRANAPVSRSPGNVLKVDGEGCWNKRPCRPDKQYLPDRQLASLNPISTCDMAPKSLLRYIFRHGPNAKARAATTPPSAVSYEPKDITPAPSNKPAPHREITSSNEEPKSPLAYKIRSESRQSCESSILENIAEESGSDDDKSSSGETITLFEHNIQALGTRELVTATLYEARVATHAHLDSIDATLGLLDALDGFSATITVLKAEFKGRKETCEEKLRMLGDVESAVERMQFAEEGHEQEK